MHVHVMTDRVAAVDVTPHRENDYGNPSDRAMPDDRSLPIDVME